MTKDKTILSQNWSFRAKNWPKIAKKKIGQKQSQNWTENEPKI